MKHLSTKQQERSEKKKKKLAALANLIQMNDNDRMEAKKMKAQRIEEMTTAPAGFEKKPEVADNDGFVTVSYKKKSSKNKKVGSTSAEGVEDGPKPKRAKLTIRPEDVQNSDCSERSSVEEAGIEQLRLTFTDEQYRDIRRQLRERKRHLEQVPMLRLRECGERALLDKPDDERTPLFLTDIQHLLMASLIGKKSPCAPDRWCSIEQSLQLTHSVVLVLEGLSLYQYISNESHFEQANKIFKTRLEVVLPPCKDGTIIEEIAKVPLTNAQAEQLVEQHGSLESAIEMNKDPTLLVKTIFPIDLTSEESSTKDIHPEDKFPRTKLLLSALQMVDEGYPLPLRGELNKRFQNYVFTKEKYMPVNDRSPMFGVDCEMCVTSVGRGELTRISIVNEQLDTVYESFVRPTNTITDYLTQYSGITAEIMATVTKSLEVVQTEVKNLLPADAILVGQSLNCDLNAMRMMHPYVIDTSVIFNLSGLRKRKTKLRTLALTFLDEIIQEFKQGHDSIEDSLAAIKLVKKKLANSLEYGDEILIQKKRLHEITRVASAGSIKNNLFAHVSKRDKRTAIITAGAVHPPIKEIIQEAEKSVKEDKSNTVLLYEMESNKKALKKAREVALEHSLTITNLKLNIDNVGPDHTEKTIKTLDKWIKKLWGSIANNGMFVVLMGGSTECPNGVASIAIKKNLPEVVSEEPITNL